MNAMTIIGSTCMIVVVYSMRCKEILAGGKFNAIQMGGGIGMDFSEGLRAL